MMMLKAMETSAAASAMMKSTKICPAAGSAAKNRFIAMKFNEAAEKMFGLADRIEAGGIPLHHIDLGGGLGVSYEGGAGPDPEAYAGICFTDVPEGQYNIGAAIPRT